MYTDNYLIFSRAAFDNNKLNFNDTIIAFPKCKSSLLEVSQILQAKLRIILVINKLILQLKLLQCKVQVRLT